MAAALQREVQRGVFRVYTHHDVIGCEIGGALKNVIAIATGMAQGLGVGDNTRAAVMSRGLAELTTLAVAMGGEAATMAGLAGMGDLVARLHARDDVRLGIATGKSRRGVDHLVAFNCWDGWFSTTQTADDAPSKPDPAMLVQAMAEAGIGPTSTVMVGDTSYDMAMAVAAGAAAIGVAWGYHPADALKGAGAQTVAATFADVGRWIDEWNPAGQANTAVANG